MSSSFPQLVLDIIVFAMLQYFFISPLITKLLDFVNGQDTTWDEITIYETLRVIINGETKEEVATTTIAAAFTTGLGDEETECEKCGVLLEETQACITRTRCQCTWCANCVEECFELVEFDLDATLMGLSRSCEAARGVTMRAMLPWIRDVLSEKTRRYVDVMGSIEMEKNDWMLDVDEQTE